MSPRISPSKLAEWFGPAGTADRLQSVLDTISLGPVAQAVLKEAIANATKDRERITELESALEALYEAGYWVLVDGPRTPNPIPTTETQTDLWQRAKDALRDSSPERGPE